MLSLADCAACLTVSLPCRIWRQHVAEDIAVLDVDPVLRRRDEPAAGRRALVHARAEQVRRVRDVALRLQRPSRGSCS